MWGSVREAWPSFISAREGRTNFMYLDTLRFVTFGVGRKIDENGKISSYGLALPWRNKDFDRVLEAVILKEFTMIKSHTELAPQGGNAFKAVSTLHVTEADIDEALFETTADFWHILQLELPNLESWPASAQLALMDMAYNLGPNFLGPGWPNFTAAAKHGDFGLAAAHCHTAKHTRRDADHTSLFLNAAAVSYAGLNPARLWDVGQIPIVDTWKPPGKALTRITLTEVLNATPNLFNAHAWYVQAMLIRAGFYSQTLHDGFWGPHSKASYTAWAKKHGENARPTLEGLRKLSSLTIWMPVN
jgi:GH24 family phage-related lysozyme (muramidase)